MNETLRTLIYAVVGVIAIAIAWWARPATIERRAMDDSGERFFAAFDPLEARSLEIVSVSEDTGTPRAFKVAQSNGVWTIPSHEGYPADAAERLAGAAASVMDLIKGPSVSDSPADHELFGVVDPKAPGASIGAGTRVTLSDGNDRTLIDLIIGKPVKDAPQLRYVREPIRDRVYSVQIAADQLSTKFEEWIERDLLKLEPMQIKEIFIDDYSIDEVNQRLVRGEQLTLRYDHVNIKWLMDGLAPDEEVNASRVNETRQALDDLQIVDVRRKPAGLSSQLQASGDMRVDGEAVASLMSKGYYIVQNQLLSNEGETVVRMRNGVEYSLRFGEIARYDEGSTLDQSGEDGTSPGTSAGRYVFVTAQFNQGMIDPPVYEELPEGPATESAGDGASDEAGAATQPATQPSLGDIALQEARKHITEANDKKRAEYEAQIAEGQAKVKELNARFADWYYVVSDEVYQKLRLNRAAVVQKKTAEGEGAVPPVEGEE